MADSDPTDMQGPRPESEEDLAGAFLSTFDSRQTRRNYRTDLKQFFEAEAVGREQVERVRKRDVVDFLREQAARVKRATLERRVETLKSFYRWLAQRGLVDTRPLGTDERTKELVDGALEEAYDDEDSQEAFREENPPPS
jgi:site-specific recombinase XerD